MATKKKPSTDIEKDDTMSLTGTVETDTFVDIDFRESVGSAFTRAFSFRNKPSSSSDSIGSNRKQYNSEVKVNYNQPQRSWLTRCCYLFLCIALAFIALVLIVGLVFPRTVRNGILDSHGAGPFKESNYILAQDIEGSLIALSASGFVIAVADSHEKHLQLYYRHDYESKWEPLGEPIRDHSHEMVELYHSIVNDQVIVVTSSSKSTLTIMNYDWDAKEWEKQELSDKPDWPVEYISITDDASKIAVAGYLMDEASENGNTPLFGITSYVVDNTASPALWKLELSQTIPNLVTIHDFYISSDRVLVVGKDHGTFSVKTHLFYEVNLATSELAMYDVVLKEVEAGDNTKDEKEKIQGMSFSPCGTLLAVESTNAVQVLDIENSTQMEWRGTHLFKNETVLASMTTDSNSIHSTIGWMVSPFDDAILLLSHYFNHTQFMEQYTYSWSDWHLERNTTVDLLVGGNITNAPIQFAYAEAQDGVIAFETMSSNDDNDGKKTKNVVHLFDLEHNHYWY